MTRHRPLYALCLVALALGLSGCGAKIPPTHHYTLETLPAPAAAGPAASAAPLPVSIAVARFQASRALAQDRLVFRPSATQVDFYEYHRWVETPPEMVTQNLIRHLRATQALRSVTALQGAPQTDYILRGTIESLEEVDSGDSVSGRVALIAELVDTKTRAIVWTGRGSHQASVEPRSVEGIVRVLNDGVRQSLDQITRGLITHLQQRPAQ